MNETSFSRFVKTGALVKGEMSVKANLDGARTNAG